MNQDTIHIEITYNAPVDEIWSVLTDKERVKEWFFDVSSLDTVVGAVFEFSKPGFKRDFLHRCCVMEAEEGRLFRYSWAYPGLMEGESTVTWELIPRSNVTSLRLTHEGISVHQQGGASFTAKRFESGWGNILGKSLANYLER